MRENTIYGIIWRKYTIQNKTEKANSARARTVAFGDWGVGDCGTGARSLRGVTHTHTRETRSSAPAAARGLRVRRPASRVRPPRSGPLAPTPQPHAPPACATHHAVPRAFAHAHATHTRSRMVHGGARGGRHQAGGPDADDGTYERTEIDRSEREATPDATRTGASGHSSCAHRPPQSARERAGLSRLHRRESSSTELSGECAISLRRERYPIYCTQEDIYTIYHTLYTLAQQMQF